MTVQEEMSRRNAETVSTGEERAMVKVVRKVSLGDQASNFAYWQSQPYQMRLATLEAIRQEYHRWHDDPEPGLQRLSQIVKR